MTKEAAFVDGIAAGWRLANTSKDHAGAAPPEAIVRCAGMPEAMHLASRSQVSWASPGVSKFIAGLMAAETTPLDHFWRARSTPPRWSNTRMSSRPWPRGEPFATMEAQPPAAMSQASPVAHPA